MSMPRTSHRLAMMFFVVPGLILIFAACKSGPSSVADEFAGKAQFVANPSFEEMAGDHPKGWEPRTWEPEAVFKVEPAGRTGNRSVMIGSEQGADASWVAVVPIRPYARYRLSGWIRTENLVRGMSKGAVININGVRQWQTPAVSGTKDWTRVEVELDAGANDALEVTCLFGGWGKATGKAWFDDVELTWLSGGALAPPAVRINAEKTGVPVSKYIYGQFIEHLGRCIYQGVWAEMLEDRKFFWPVGQGESPWKPVGDAALVTMDKVKPFTGGHTPRIALTGKTAGGLFQEALALVEGREYVGRVVLAGAQAAAPVKVSLAWGPEPGNRQVIEIKDLGPEYKSLPFVFTAGASTENARLEILSAGRGSFKVGAVSVMPASNVDGFRPEVLGLLKELDSPVYRWPGGNFASGYNWRDGIGERDKRPPRKNPAWQGVEHNDVGIHEYMDLMRILGADPYITANSGLGDVKMAVEELQYANGPADSPMGKLRAANGHSEPWGVKLWSVGNEMYGSWQLGHITLYDYVRKHIQFEVAMKAVDPSIKIVAVGAVGRWDETMLAEASNHMDYLSEHFYVGEKPGLLSHVDQVPREVRRIAEAHRKYRQAIPTLKLKEVPVALDEWNYWYGPDLYGEIGVRYFLKDALGIAEGFNEYARQSDIYVMANYAQTVNVIGAIKTTKTAAAFDTTGLVLKLYRSHFGTVPVEVTGAAEPLDVMACWKDDAKKVMTVSIINPTRTGQTVKLDFGTLRLASTANLYLIAGGDPQLYNEPGKPPAVVIEEKDGVSFGKKVTVPPVSVSLYEVAVK
jgi:alpha-L-arabinofuranosidase